MYGRRWKQLCFSADMAPRKLMEDKRLLYKENKLRVNEGARGERKMGDGY